MTEIIEGWSMWTPYSGLTLDIHSTRNRCVAWWLWNLGVSDSNDEPWTTRKLSKAEKREWRKLRSEGYKPVKVFLSTQEPVQ